MDEELYQVVRKELQDGFFEEDLWQRALTENNNNKVEAEHDYIESRVNALKQLEDQREGTDNISETESSDSGPSREPVKKRNIIIGISLLVFLFALIILLGFLLHDYFN